MIRKIFGSFAPITIVSGIFGKMGSNETASNLGLPKIGKQRQFLSQQIIRPQGSTNPGINTNSIGPK